MKYSIIALSLMATIPVACSPAANEETSETTDTSAASDDMMPGTETAMTDFPEITDGMTGPVFTGPEGSVNVAVSGYDVVSYFEGEGVPIEGSEEFKVNYNDVDYHFSSAENAEKFEADADKYAPQYGGHCAWAMSRGRLAPGDPTKYRIVEGKLYLNFNQMVQDMWLKDISGFIEKADNAWPQIPAEASFDDQ